MIRGLVFCSLLAGSLATGLTAWDTACQFGGLVVNKAGHRLTASSCDSRFPKENWQPPLPTVEYPAAKEDGMYTVFALDPDAPNHPNGTYYLHMLEANIMGSDLRAGDFSKANSIASYVGPAPPEGTGLHRYMIVVYRHSPGFRVRDQPTPERFLFDFQKWMAKEGKGLQGPEAGTQFRCGP